MYLLVQTTILILLIGKMVMLIKWPQKEGIVAIPRFMSFYLIQIMVCAVRNYTKCHSADGINISDSDFVPFVDIPHSVRMELSYDQVNKVVTG